MAKKRPNTRQVRIDEDLVIKADFIASSQGLSTPELLSAMLRPLIDRKFDETVAKVKKREVDKAE